jgi:uncharacterized protein (TIGR02594 family)
MVYEVKNGDTLSKIAKENNTTVDEILKNNNINNPNQIYPKQKLNIGLPSVKLQIVDAVMRPIESLEVKLHFNNQEMCYISDSNGWLPEITSVKTNDSIKIEVKKITGEYKALGSVLAGTKAKKVTVQSPNVAFKAKTMPDKTNTTSASRPTVPEKKTVHTTQTANVNQTPTHYAIASNHAPWVDIALKEEKKLVHENKNKNLMEPEINKYYQAANYKPGWKIDDDNDKDAWCGCFMAWVMKEAGYKPVVNAANSQSWKEFGKPIDYPIFGAIAVRKRVGNNGHVAIVIGQSKDGKRIIVVGGNQSDAVNIRSFPKADKKNNWSYRIPVNYNKKNATLPIDYDGTIAGGKTR